MRHLCLLMLASAAFAQVPPRNLGFEEDELGGKPPGWNPISVSARLVESGCQHGKCVEITATPDLPADSFGNLMQSVPAESYRLRRIRMRGAMRVANPRTRVQMWLRVDRTDRSMAFLENSANNPVTSTEWVDREIQADVPDDAGSIQIGFLVFGNDAVWADDVRFETIGEIVKEKTEAPRPLETQELTNLRAFTRLYGYVRFFHPSDQAAATDWETFAIEGARAMAAPASSAELIAALQKVFAPIAPTVDIYETGKRPVARAIAATDEVMRYQHTGVGLKAPGGGRTPYSSVRVRVSSKIEKKGDPFRTEIAPGITVSVPLTLAVDSEGTFPHLPLPDATQSRQRSANDRGTRLGDVVIAWNIFQHFYPYFDVVKTDWSAELTTALRSASTDANGTEFAKTLKRLVAALKDGHGGVYGTGDGSFSQPPITMDWVEGQFLVTRVQTAKSEGVAAGDRVLKSDGRPIAQAAEEERSLISAASDGWMRWRLASELSRCKADANKMILEVEPYAAQGASKTVELPCGRPKTKSMESYTEVRPQKITELELGIFYVDLDRVTDADWQEVVPKLEKATGIIFDMRGYPSQPGIQSLAHLTDNPLRSAKWNIPQPGAPDRTEFPFMESGWPEVREITNAPARVKQAAA